MRKRNRRVNRLSSGKEYPVTISRDCFLQGVKYGGMVNVQGPVHKGTLTMTLVLTLRRVLGGCQLLGVEACTRLGNKPD